MKLLKVKVTEFQSIIDSNEFEIGDITCLVGKNEAGKTALLKALYRLNPIISKEGVYDVTHDYPRNQVEDYKYDVESNRRPSATVVTATFLISDEDLEDVYEKFGKDSITKSEMVIYKGYAHAENTHTFLLYSNTENALTYLFSKAKLDSDTQKKLLKATDAKSALEILNEEEQTSEIENLITILAEIEKGSFNKYIYDNYLGSKIPKFLYFDEYYQMKGLENIQALIQRNDSNSLKDSDHPILGLIKLARLDLTDLANPQDTQELKNKLQGAGNHLSGQVLKYWSQNRHIQMQFDVRQGLPKDPEEMRTGMNIWAEVYDSRHKVSTNLGTRSRGFVWFFSFLAWYSEVKRKNEPIIILLDEPALSLHAKAQEDLLKYFEAEIKGEHQLIYTTHSPFMVDPQHFERVRIVQDKGIDVTEPLLLEDEGTRVITGVNDASEDSLFPLQGALGYEIYQTLFVGPNSLVVEGVSDLIFLQVMSAFLEGQGRTGLDNRWTITPVGGSDKVPTFIALIGSQKGLKVATLIDIQKKDEQKIENLYKKKLLKKNFVTTFAEFTKKLESDIEDMFDPSFYISIVNDEYKNELNSLISQKDLNKKIPRITVQLEDYFKKNPLKNGFTFNHFRPARFMTEKMSILSKKISEETIERFEEAFKKVNSLL